MLVLLRYFSILIISSFCRLLYIDIACWLELLAALVACTWLNWFLHCIYKLYFYIYFSLKVLIYKLVYIYIYILRLFIYKLSLCIVYMGHTYMFSALLCLLSFIVSAVYIKVHGFIAHHFFVWIFYCMTFYW